MKIYFAGKVNPDSKFAGEGWRDAMSNELSKLTGLNIKNLDPIVYEADIEFDASFIFNKDCWLINQADCVVVNLSDDISVGGSQEMLIAKYLKKPLIGLVRRGGKFLKDRRLINGEEVENYINPFVFSTCDVVVEDIQGVAESLVNLPQAPKDITIIDQAIIEADRQLNA